MAGYGQVPDGSFYRPLRELPPQQKVNLLRAIARLLRDKRHSPLRRFADASVLVLGIPYVGSPVDFVPEALAGPLGFADDAGVAARLAWLLVMAAKHYRTSRQPSGV